MLISCPECQKQLNLNAELVPGKRIKCPSCQHVFDPSGETDSGFGATTESSFGAKIGKTGRSGIEKLLIGAAIAVVVGVVGVNLWKMVGNGGAANQPVTTVPTVSDGPPITDEEAQQFCQKLENAVNDEQLAVFQNLWNFNAILDKALSGVSMSDRDKTEFKRGAASGLPAFAAQIFQQARMGSYDYLNSRESETGIKQVTFRLQNAEGLNYHRFDLIRNDGGQVTAGDVHIATSGEYFSTTMRRIVLPLAASMNRSLLQKMQGADGDMVGNFPKIQQIQSNTQAGNGAAALSIYETLPDSLKQQKFMLLLRLGASQQVGDEEYVRTMEMFLKHHPNDVSLKLLLIDYYIYKEQYEKCLATIDQLDESVGGDPYLNIMKAGVVNTQGDSQKARGLLEPLLDDEQYAERAYGVFLDVVLAEDDHGATTKTLQILEQQFKYEFGDITQVDDFARYVQSEEYKQWMANR